MADSMSDKYKDEAQQRWGQTDSYQIAAQRTQSYTPEDWIQIKSEAADIYRIFHLNREAYMDCVELRNAVRRWQLHINQWFYPCDDQLLLGLADLYEMDMRFQDNIDKIGGEGTAQCMILAIRHHASSNLPV